jgi:hypothetical protein
MATENQSVSHNRQQYLLTSHQLFNSKNEPVMTNPIKRSRPEEENYDD